MENDSVKYFGLKAVVEGDFILKGPIKSYKNSFEISLFLEEDVYKIGIIKKITKDSPLNLNYKTCSGIANVIVPDESYYKEYIRQLQSIESIGEIIDNTNVEISVENMPVRGKFLANTVEEIEMIQEATGCSLTIDTGHGNTCGNLEEMLSLKNISYCHLNDNDGVKDQHITLGEGTMDLNLLKKIDTAIIELNNFDNILKSKEVIDNL